jgi:gamma-glutamylcyclotransferase (GGCT)/AIG2-like uncharacterized protein YtfP
LTVWLIETVLPDRDYPEDPYPGAVPDCSFVHLDERSHPIRPDRTALAGWRLGALDLDGWLAERGAARMAERVPVVAFGSNRCPSKITWLRRTLGLTGPVVAVRAEIRDVAAVWASGLRLRDGQRPAVLTAAPGVTESHAVWFATRDQVEVLDRCEGRDDRYRLARLPTSVRGEDGGLIDNPWCYLALGAIRRPLLVDGRGPVRCADLPQERARLLDGDPAEGDGLAAETVRGAPHPDEWPAALFSYGLLRPGHSGWPLVAPHAAGTPRPARATGAVYDTGLGWPALLLDGPGPLDGPGEVSGTVVPLRDPVTLLPTLDDFEGPDYRRVRLALDDGTIAWAYVWIGDHKILQ